MGTGTGVWVHDVFGGQYVHQGSQYELAVSGEQVQAAEGGWDGVGDGELRTSLEVSMQIIEFIRHLHTDSMMVRE